MCPAPVSNITTHFLHVWQNNCNCVARHRASATPTKDVPHTLKKKTGAHALSHMHLSKLLCRQPSLFVTTVFHVRLCPAFLKKEFFFIFRVRAAVGQKSCCVCCSKFDKFFSISSFFEGEIHALNGSGFDTSYETWTTQLHPVGLRGYLVCIHWQCAQLQLHTNCSTLFWTGFELSPVLHRWQIGTFSIVSDLVILVLGATYSYVCCTLSAHGKREKGERGRMQAREESFILLCLVGRQKEIHHQCLKYLFLKFEIEPHVLFI